MLARRAKKLRELLLKQKLRTVLQKAPRRGFTSRYVRNVKRSLPIRSRRSIKSHNHQPIVTLSTRKITFDPEPDLTLPGAHPMTGDRDKSPVTTIMDGIDGPKSTQSYLEESDIEKVKKGGLSTRDAMEIQYTEVRRRNEHQKVFLEAVEEVLGSLEPLFVKYPEYLKVIPAICEPERAIHFRVPWIDDEGNHRVNRGFRVQFNQSIGPYKGGLRFHPSVNLGIVKFLGFEQIFKNALTGVSMGGAKGGSDFDPKGKSETEVLRFCQSFMTELSRYIGPDTDVPAGDIGVGGREIGFLYGQWLRMTSLNCGVLTGKGELWGGSLIRPEATGYGLVYMVEIGLRERRTSIKSMRVALSGSGNVATYAAEKVIELGGIPVSFSDSGGSIIEPNGFSQHQLEQLCKIKDDRGRCEDYLAISKNAQFVPKQFPWSHVECDVALPCATENEITGEDAILLVSKGCKYVGEGANMPCTHEAINVFQENCKFFFPGKASNAGGVAVSGLEMAQNSQRVRWSRQMVDKRLFAIMEHIYTQCRDTAAELGHENDFQLGANAAGFRIVADAMLTQGLYY